MAVLNRFVIDIQEIEFTKIILSFNSVWTSRIAMAGLENHRSFPYHDFLCQKDIQSFREAP